MGAEQKKKKHIYKYIHTGDYIFRRVILHVCVFKCFYTPDTLQLKKCGTGSPAGTSTRARFFVNYPFGL